MGFRFQGFKVYQDAKILHSLTVKIIYKFPREYLHLVDQMRRAALSVVLNIAEGSAKQSDRDFNRYIHNGLGSINELAAAYDIAYSEKLISLEIYQKMVKLTLEVKNQLGGLAKKLLVRS